MGEVRQIRVHIQRKTVHRDTTGHPHTYGCYFARFRPHSRVARFRPRFHAERRQRFDQHSLQLVHIQPDALGVLQRQDGVPDQLARPVVGDVTAAVHEEQLRGHFCQPLVGHQHVGPVAVPAHGIRVWMLEQQEIVIL